MNTRPLTCLGLALVAACSRPPETPIMIPPIDSAFVSDLEAVAKAKIWFGHQSVGSNILDGLAALAKEAGVTVHLEEAAIGENMQPLAKFEAFAKRAETTPDDGLQLMTMKLCYIDIAPEADVRALVDAYVRAVTRVQKARPGIKILHVTPPLTTRPTGLKNALKRLLGVSVWGDASNEKRTEFAAAMKQAFPGAPFFDLAEAEAAIPTGGREQHAVNGKTVPALWPGYTDDDGHLNPVGQRLVAMAFVRALAKALRS